jgi:LytS/YehU family sensor histidine kinase
VQVFNDKADAPEAPVPGTQLGMATTRDRLLKTYGDEFSLTCHFNQTDGSRVKVVLPLRSGPPANSILSNRTP